MNVTKLTEVLYNRYNDCVNDLQSLDLNENDAILDILSIKH